MYLCLEGFAINTIYYNMYITVEFPLLNDDLIIWRIKK